MGLKAAVARYCCFEGECVGALDRRLAALAACSCIACLSAAQRTALQLFFIIHAVSLRHHAYTCSVCTLLQSEQRDIVHSLAAIELTNCINNDYVASCCTKVKPDRGFMQVALCDDGEFELFELVDPGLNQEFEAS